MTHLIVLIGLPGSGKSCLAAALSAEYSGSPVVSTDAIRAQLFGSESIQGSWSLVWGQARQQLQQAVAQSSLAIYDATNAVRPHRIEAIALARTLGFTQITGLWVDTPLSLCLERNRQRDRTVPKAVILQMHSSLQSAPPTLQDGLDQLIRYSCASTEIAIAPLRKNRTQDD